MNKSFGLRQAIGWLGFTIPIALILGSWTGGFVPMRTSISSYNWANDSVLFIALLVICGSFLIFYNDYNKKLTTTIGVAMIGVACFPCEGGTSYLFLFLSPSTCNIIHGICAFTTFSLLGYLSYFEFTKFPTIDSVRIGNVITKEKLTRNNVYKVCGLTIFGSIIVIAIITLVPNLKELTDKVRLFYWLETLILWSFSLSWLVKGQVMLKDEL